LSKVALGHAFRRPGPRNRSRASKMDDDTVVDAKVTDQIKTDLQAEDPNRVRAACRLAVELEIKGAVADLIRLLDHRHWQVRVEAVRALGRLGKGMAAVEQVLMKALEANETTLRRRILIAASPEGPAAAPVETAGAQKKSQPPAVQKEAAVALNRLRPDIAENVLIETLSGANPALIQAAMSGLVSLESETGVDLMIQLLGHDDHNTRKAAVVGLGRLRVARAVPHLIELLEDHQAEVRRQAVIALNHLKAREAVDPLVRRMADESAEVRRVTAIALGNTRVLTPQVEEALLAALTDRQWSVRQAAAAGLANLKAIDHLDRLIELLTDPRDEVRAEAALACHRLLLWRDQPDYDRGSEPE
jgi:HEAT repeat protein